MNEHAFDRMMAGIAHRNAPATPTAKLNWALERLDAEASRPARRVAFSRRRALILAFALTLALCAAAAAATLGLSHFFERNPYTFAHQPGQTTDGARLSPLTLLDDGGLSLLRVEPVDSAWIDGRLTLSVLVSPADAQEPLLAGELNGDGTASLYPDTAQPPTALEDAQSARILLIDNVALYTAPEADDGWPGYPSQIETSQQDAGTLLAMQLEPDFVSASELVTLTQDGRFPFRLELVVSEHGALRFESVTLAAALPDENEKEVMNP